MDRCLGAAGAILDHHGDEGAEPEGKALQNLTYDHELWVMIERMRLRIQVAEIIFLKRISGFS